MTSQSHHLFCFGFGYCATYVAKSLHAQGWQISGTSTTAAGAAHIAKSGYRGLVFDGAARSADVGAALQNATHVLMSIPPGATGDAALTWHGDDIAKSKSIAWLGYYSTIGVYGDAKGGWVDETTPPNPGNERGKRRLDAELSWQALGSEHGKRVMILRLPGIYGPGRSTLDDLKEGTARRLIKPGQVFNRMHVEDIAVATEAAMAEALPSRVYNLIDDEAAPPQDVVAYGAELLGLPCPPDIDFATATLSPMAQSFYSESKRVANARMKAELGVSLKYPTYREGLAAILRLSA